MLNMTNNLCKICGKPQEKMIMQIITAPCWKCHAAIKIALISPPSFFGPEKFTTQQLEFARSKGVVIKKINSQTSESTYFANTYSNCDQFVGAFFIHEYLDRENAENIDLGYYCTACDPAKYFALNQFSSSFGNIK
jgi:hypothetical protein